MSTNRSILKHAAIYSSATVLAKAIGFVMLPFYAHIFKDEGYGVIGMVDATLNLLMSLFSYGIAGGIIRIYHEEPPGRKRLVISTAVAILWIGCLAITLPMMAFARPFSLMLLGDSAWSPYLGMALLTFTLDLTGQAAGTILVIEQRSVAYSLISLARLFLGLGLNIWLILGLDLGIHGYFIAGLATAAFAAIALHAVAIRSCGTGYDRAIARKLLAFELPLVPGNLVSFASRQIERVLLRFMVGIGSVGVFEMGCKFPSFLVLLVTEPFMRSWTTKRMEFAHAEGAPSQIGRMFTIFLFLLVLAGLVMAVTIENVFHIITPPEFWPGVRIAKVEIVTTVLLGCYYHLYFGMIYAKDTKSISLIRSVTSAAKVGLSFVCITLWGIDGAAYSALVTTAVQTVWSAIRSQALYPMEIEYRKAFTLVAVAGGIYLALETLPLGAFPPVDWLERRVVPSAVGLLRQTFLAAWKDGAAVQVLEVRSLDIALAAVKGTIALSFVAVLPWVDEGVRKRASGYLRRWTLR